MKREVTNLRFREVSGPSVYAGFKEVDFGEDHLVVEAFEFGE